MRIFNQLNKQTNIMPQTLTEEHLVVLSKLPRIARNSLRLLSKMMKFRDLVDFLIGDDSKKEPEFCILLAELAYHIDENLEIPNSTNHIQVIYSLN
jgi:hypothetical protein